MAVPRMERQEASVGTLVIPLLAQATEALLLKINIILRPKAKSKIRAASFDVDAPIEREFLIQKQKRRSPWLQRLATARKIMSSFLGNIEGWRSEEMQLVQLMIPSEAAHQTVMKLGEIGLLQFRDMNADRSAAQRIYANQVKRSDEMARRLRFLTDQVYKASVAVPAGSANRWSGQMLTVDELEARLEELEKEIIDHNNSNERLVRSSAELGELQVLLECGGQFFNSGLRLSAETEGASGPEAPASDDFSAPLLGSKTQSPDLHEVDGGAGSKLARLGFVAGLITLQRMDAFERILFRATRGNVFIRNTAVGSILDPSTGEKMEKSVFVVFYAGERAKAKIMKICEAFGVNRYPFPEESFQQRKMHSEVSSRLKELKATIDAGELHRQGVLQNIAQNLDSWTLLVRKEKAVYHTLNKMNMDLTSKVLVAEAWVPCSARPQVAEALRVAAEQSQAQVRTVLQPLAMHHETPPTYFKTNKFTSCFQTIVDAYGVANYREVNPAIFTMMTFPFLFAVMFGDFGHGILMLLFALVLVLNERSLGSQALDDITSMLFSGRYCILLMSLFSIYTGVIYNEFFSIPMTIAGPTHFQCYIDGHASPTTQLRDCGHSDGVIVRPGDYPYPFGVDPAWRGTKTELPYLNSLKMKMSIIIGVIHMNLGILMSLYNNNYFGDTLSTLCEFVPQVIFLNSLFGYLSILIAWKWISGMTTDLYHVLIYMFLKPGVIDQSGYAFPGQGPIQNILLLCAFIAVPWMLFPKPLILKARADAAKKATGSASAYSRMEDAEQPEAGTSSSAHHGGGGHGDHDGEFDFGEVMVHQMIHAIEFILGAVSNTASYLRLWALSLAHSQLSAVFYDRVLMAGVQSDSWVAIFIAFFVWACATIGVLMVMESLSAFLHALRLHWVEFQNKFYKGTGWAFSPFSFADAASLDEASSH